MSSVALDDDAKFSFAFAEDDDKPEGSSDMREDGSCLKLGRKFR